MLMDFENFIVFYRLQPVCDKSLLQRELDLELSEWDIAFLHKTPVEARHSDCSHTPQGLS